jgi:ABC-type Mn2+/Zn2+ transport system permease subunit
VISFVGIYLSYYFDVASGASVVLLSTAVFAVVLLWNTYRNRKRPIIPPHVG